MRAFLCLSALTLTVVSLPGDTLQLRDGRQIQGTFEGGNAGGIRFRAYNEARGRSYDISRVSTVMFDTNNATFNGGTSTNIRGASGSTDRVGDMPRGTEYATGDIETDGNYIPAGAVVSVRTTDPIDSDASQIGNTYQGSLAQPIMVNGNTIVPLGSPATLQVRGAGAGNRLTGRGDISLQLISITGSNGATYEIQSTDAVVLGDSRGPQSADVAVVGDTLGAIIGGIADPTAGGAIGAGSGAAVGGHTQLMRGRHIRIRPDTVLSFELQQNVVF